MKRLLILILFFLVASDVATTALAAEITPADVYGQAVQIEKEITLLMEHLGVKPVPPTPVIKAEIQPRHVWQKAYLLFTQINIFRHQHGLPRITPNAIEPVLNLPPGLVYEQTQRLLTELSLIKLQLGITARVSPPARVTGKTPVDVFNKLNHISRLLDALNGEDTTPTYVFAEVMRLNEDVDTILQHHHIFDNTFPPAHDTTVTPKESLDAAFALLAEVQRLQKLAGVTRADLSAFAQTDQVRPADVLNMVGMTLAELQTVKAAMDLTYAITPPAVYHEAKSAADVAQLLRWLTQKIRLIQAL